MAETTLASQILSDQCLAALRFDEAREYFKPCLDALEFAVPDRPFPIRQFKKKPGHTVYFVAGAGGAIKIGFTQQQMAKRLKCLQNGSPVKLEVLATRQAVRDCEGYYHRRFAAHRLHGEWFEPAPAILAEIERLKAGAA